jgi:hypothetical protein
VNKQSILWIILDLIFLIVFNTVFFTAVSGDATASVWIAYGFIHFAYIMVLVTTFLIRKSSSVAILGLSLYAISSSYFLLEMLAGIIFIFMKSESYKVSLCVQMILAGLYGIILIAHLLANERTAESIERYEGDVAYIKNTSARVNALIGKVNDKKVNKEIEKVYDFLHSSPTRTDISVYPIEAMVAKKVDELENLVYEEDISAIHAIATDILNLMDERNKKVRLIR